MPLHPLVAAKRVCELREWEASNLEVNKILYLAHMVFLGRNAGIPLVTEHFQAWDYGPVLPSVYHRAKAFGSGPVQNVFKAIPDADANSDEARMIAEAVASVQGMSPGHLVAITHWAKGAWAIHYRPGERGTPIPNNDILTEYRLRVG